ncbi:MAG: tRNA 4-thiouridine(8) synthase ThiI [Sphaerobacteraceae bacterium]|nr:MAG: tRNA 4-thiouridine(8) synthase ThiI [Sphaerobacteraceae bacterium]
MSRTTDDLTALDVDAVDFETTRLQPVIVLRVHEIALKGLNRRWFMQILRENLMFALRGLDVANPRSRSSRTFIDLNDLSQWHEVRERLRHVFGIANFSLAIQCRARMRSIRSALHALFKVEGLPTGSFCVRARRANKNFSKSSPEIERELGSYIQRRSDAPVNLRHPDRTYRVEVLHEAAYVSSDSIQGPGGLPVGVSGRVVVLMSGGFDSPIAVYRMMKRGCHVTMVHCHAHPFVRSTSIEKVVELAQMLGEHQRDLRLLTVPIGEAQQAIAIASDPALRVVLYRRLMIRIATAVAESEGAAALVTGESVGQVSSQTLENIHAIGSATDLPILRPLIGFDKAEIMEEGRQLGTDVISSVPDDDCCTVFVPQHPTTHATIEECLRAEAGMDVSQMVLRSLERQIHYSGNPREWDVNLALDTVSA